MFLIDISISHIYEFEEPISKEKKEKYKENTNFKKTFLLITLGVFIHNFPEGMVTFAGTLKDVELGFLLAFAITLHNIPEGIAVAIPIYSSTQSRKKAFFWSFLSGISEPIGALIFGLILFPFVNDFLLGVMLAIAGGFMVYISLDELLPASRTFGNENLSILGLIAGMFFMFLSLTLL
jgi:ZIP family zinc transporter